MGIATLIIEMSEKSTSIIYSTHCIHKAILFSGNNHVSHISEGVLIRLYEKFEINVDPHFTWTF
jgi:hypothetical protein